MECISTSIIGGRRWQGRSHIIILLYQAIEHSSETDVTDPHSPSTQSPAAERPTSRDPPKKQHSTVEFDRPKLSPPDVLIDPIYSVVDKTRRYPAPGVPPPPPPPYEGKVPSVPPPPPPDTTTDRATSPPGYEIISSADCPSPKAPKGGAPRPPPSRPSRPPEGRPPPTGIMLLTQQILLSAANSRTRRATVGTVSDAAAKARKQKLKA